MTPEVGILLGQLLLKYGPDVAKAVHDIFTKPNPTLADWLPVFDMVKSYEELVPNSKLPKT